MSTASRVWRKDERDRRECMEGGREPSRALLTFRPDTFPPDRPDGYGYCLL